MKPRVFIGSAKEVEDVATAIHSTLVEYAEVTVWGEDVFDLSDINIERLEEVLGHTDFGILVFHPTDKTVSRGKSYAAVRDNVIFECGMFVGRLGRKRTFLVKPASVTNFKLPSDLLGVSIGTYEDTRSDGNLKAAVTPFCRDVIRQIKKSKPRACECGKHFSFSHDIFVSTILAGFEDSSKLEVHNSLMKKVVASLRKEQFSVYYAAEHLDDTTDFHETDITSGGFVRARGDIDVVKRCKVFLMVYPEKATSSCLFEAGLAFGDCKQSIVLCRDVQDLPFMIRQASKACNDLKIYTYKSDATLLKTVSAVMKDVIAGI
jgi:Predicted nucleotide-binding protein containing TIR-like domain